MYGNGSRLNWEGRLPTKKEREQQQGPGIPTTPRYPETTPQMIPSGDYTYVLEVVMQMQKSMGQLTEAVGTLKESRSEQNKKLETITEKLEKINRKIYAALILLLAIGSVLTFFAKSINDAITSKLLAPVTQQQLNAPPSTQPTQQIPSQTPRN
jgi:hypothetical protein